MDRIKFSQSFISFIEQTKDESKVSKYLHHYIYDNQVVTRHIRADKINYLTFRKNGAISYLPFGRELKLTDNGEWARDGRQEGKPAKTITQIMRGAMLRAVTNRDLEIFSNLYKGQASDLYTFKVASGEDLRAVYNLEVPFTSCMNGSSNSSKLDLYVKNPDKVSVVYIQTGNTCQARALLWTDNDGNKIIDRVYGSEEFRTMFRDYAKEIGAWKKVYDGAGHSNFFNPEGEAMYKDFYIEVDGEHDRYPYVDTFCYLKDDETPNVLTNSDNYDATKKLQDTGGGYDDLEGVECYNRSGTYPESDCVWSDYHDAHIHEDDYIYINHDYYYADNGSTEEAIRISRREWVLVDDCEEVECFNKEDLDGDGILELDGVVTFTCYKLPDGDLIPTDDATIVDVFVIDGEIMGETDC
jgi:hypothetical protein